MRRPSLVRKLIVLVAAAVTSGGVVSATLAAWQEVQRLSVVGSLIGKALAICLDRAVVRVANGRCEWKSCNDQTRNWFWFCPPPPWQAELLHDAAPRNLAALAVWAGAATVD